MSADIDQMGFNQHPDLILVYTRCASDVQARRVPPVCDHRLGGGCSSLDECIAGCEHKDLGPCCLESNVISKLLDNGAADHTVRG